jgi:hypothetical protein
MWGGGFNISPLLMYTAHVRTLRLQQPHTHTHIHTRARAHTHTHTHHVRSTRINMQHVFAR